MYTHYSMYYLKCLTIGTNSICNQNESIFITFFTVSKREKFGFSNTVLVKKTILFVFREK